MLQRETSFRPDFTLLCGARQLHESVRDLKLVDRVALFQNGQYDEFFRAFAESGIVLAGAKRFHEESSRRSEEEYRALSDRYVACFSRARAILETLPYLPQ